MLSVSIAVDDFGAGLSSLSYRAKLPVDTLKIDRSFTIDLTEASAGRAHAPKLRVVAQGVETE